jgi:hypothetical protein
LPHADQLVDARILKVNKLGAYALVVDEGRALEAMRILVPRDLHIGSAEFDAISVGQGIRVKLLRSRFQSKDTFIQSVGLFEGMAPAANKKEEAEADAEEEQDAEVEGKEVIEALAPDVIEPVVETAAALVA